MNIFKILDKERLVVLITEIGFKSGVFRPFRFHFVFNQVFLSFAEGNDAETSSFTMTVFKLIENIFEPNTPLHDGAVIIRGNRIVAASCMLTTLSESNSISRDLGTRHRAAIGISETTDATVLVVSEETGVISMARGGRLTRHLDADTLTEILSGLYQRSNNSIFSIFARAQSWIKGVLHNGKKQA